jgi:hypothetical protein
MKYQDGQEVRLGDHVRLGGESTGTVVFSIDTDEYTSEFPRKDWSYLGTGVMIRSPSLGLLHYSEPDEDLELLDRGLP